LPPAESDSPAAAPERRQARTPAEGILSCFAPAPPRRLLDGTQESAPPAAPGPAGRRPGGVVRSGAASRLSRRLLPAVRRLLSAILPRLPLLSALLWLRVRGLRRPRPRGGGARADHHRAATGHSRPRSGGPARARP